MGINCLLHWNKHLFGLYLLVSLLLCCFSLPVHSIVDHEDQDNQVAQENYHLPYAFKAVKTNPEDNGILALSSLEEFEIHAFIHFDGALLRERNEAMSWRVLRLVLDGQDVTDSVNTKRMYCKDLQRSCATILFRPDQPLEVGRHQSMLLFNDLQGRIFSYQWSFDVVP